jgi:4-amino-4-deoxy-L-arabinose transferase-like glycosyltransferase
MDKPATTDTQPSMLKSAVTLWMKVTDPESVAISGWPAVPLTVFAITRLATLGVTQMAAGWEGRSLLGGSSLFDALCRSDCTAVTRIAQEGYSAATASQLPLFPALVAFGHFLGLPPAFSAWFFSALAGVGALLVLYRVFQRLEGDAAALWSVALVALFPLAVFQNAGHPDALLVLLTAASVMMALNGKYLASGALVAVAALVDPFALFTLAALASLQLRDRGLRRFAKDRAALAIVLPLVALAAWSLYLAIQFKAPLAYLESADGARPAAERILSAIYESRADHALNASIILAALVTAGAVSLVLKRPWLPLLAFALPWAIVMWTVGTGGLGRHAAALWPAFLPLGSFLARRPSIQVALVSASAIFFGVFLYLYAQGFPLG